MVKNDYSKIKRKTKRDVLSTNHDRFVLCFSYIVYKNDQWPNLKNLSGGLNLNRGLNMVGSLKIVSMFQDLSRRLI